MVGVSVIVWVIVSVRVSGIVRILVMRSASVTVMLRVCVLLLTIIH